MGLDEPALYDSDETMARQLLDSGHPSLAGITLEALKARGSIRLNYPDPFVPFANGFPTASGRLEFVSERMAQAGLDPVAGYTPAYEPSQQDTALAREYPLALVTPADHYFLNSIFANVAAAAAALRRRHPADPSRRCGAAGHRGGRRGAVGNARGSFLAVAEVSDRVRPGVVASTKGRWPGAGGERQRHRRRAGFGHGRRRRVPRQPGPRRARVLTRSSGRRAAAAVASGAWHLADPTASVPAQRDAGPARRSLPGP